MDAEKLASYEASLKEVEAALEDNADNPELIKLRNDLRELIQLIKDDVVAPEEVEEEKEADESVVIGRTCIISSTFQYAQIEKVISRHPDTKLPTKLGVTLFGDDELVEINVAEVRLLGPYDAKSLTVGAELQGLYGDGVWYNCTVRAKPKNGCVIVVYDEYNEEEEIPLDRIRSRAWTQDKKKSLATVKKEPTAKKSITTPGGYTIPTSILVRPGDSAAVREQKRKKLEQLKREQKKSKIEAEYEARQSSWQEHMSKAQAKFRTHSTFTRRKH